MADLEHVLKKDSGLDLNVSKTTILPKGTSQQSVFDVAQNMTLGTVVNTNPTLSVLSGNVSLASFCPEGARGLNRHRLPSDGTNAFI